MATRKPFEGAPDFRLGRVSHSVMNKIAKKCDEYMFGSPQAPSPFLKFWLVFRLFLDLFDLTQKTVEREFIRTVVQRLWQRRWPWWDGVCCGRTRWRRTRGRSSSALTRTCSSSPLRCSRWSRRGGAGTCQSLRRTGSRWEGWPPSWAAPATGWTWPRLGLLGSRGSSRTPWQQQNTSEVFQFVFVLITSSLLYIRQPSFLDSQC